MSDADALAGRLRFSNDGTAGALTVNGNVISRGGDVVLSAPNGQVGQGAVVQAQGGAAVLAAGQSVEITGRGLEGIVMQVQAPQDSAVNLGTLKGDAVGIFAGTLKHSGLIQAQTATLEGGRVVLKAAGAAEITSGARIQADGGAPKASGGQVSISSASGDVTVAPGAVISANAGPQADAGMVQISAMQGTARVAGSITASSASGTVPIEMGHGGRVEVVGHTVTLAPGATVQAVGDAGGGSILIGGDAHGANPLVPNATDTTVAAGVTLNADARVDGDGGKVIVWADNDTHFSGTLSARGGEQGGNGGFGETSGKHVLYFGGTADLAAPRGRRGTLLLDPFSINVGTTANINGDGTTGDDISSSAGLGSSTRYGS